MRMREIRGPNMMTLAICYDLSKAFGVIMHDILLSKLNSYGIRGIANEWFNSYLSNRHQYVEIDGPIGVI
jgi:hypothetical protein